MVARRDASLSELLDVLVKQVDPLLSSQPFFETLHGRREDRDTAGYKCLPF